MVLSTLLTIVKPARLATVAQLVMLPQEFARPAMLVSSSTTLLATLVPQTLSQPEEQLLPAPTALAA